MPIDYRNYPDNWQEIRAAILARAGDHCEFCDAANHAPHPVTGSRVVLTIAHLDHDVTHNDPGNLRALCQRCHNRHDAEHRRANAAATRRCRRAKAGQLELWTPD